MGLARFFHDEDDILTKKYDENVLGTADYLAPEQALDSHGVDIRADIYSLGRPSTFCLTGKPPFAEGTVPQKLIWHQTRQPKPMRIARGRTSPEALAAVIDKMMAKDPAQRYQTPAEVDEALAPWTQTPIPPPPEEEMPKSGRRPRSGGPSEALMSSASNTKLSSAPWPAVVRAGLPVGRGHLHPDAPRGAAPADPAGPARDGGRPRPSATAGRLGRGRPGPGGGRLRAGGWALVHVLTASQAPPPGPTAETPVAPAAALPPADGVRHIRTARYEADVDADGRLTGFRVHGIEFLAAPAGLPRGSYLAREEGQGALKLSDVARPTAGVVTARGDGASVRYEFGDDAVTWTAANEGDEPLSLFILFDKSVTAAGDGRGDYRTLPLGVEEWPTSAWYAGGSRLKVRGGTRAWGAPGRPWQTWYAGLAPHETRTIVLEPGETSYQEAAGIEALNRPAAAPAPGPAVQSYVCMMSLDDLVECVVFSSPDRWDCPIWAPDGRSLLCNCKSKLHRLSLSGGPPEDFPTGALARGGTTPSPPTAAAWVSPAATPFTSSRPPAATPRRSCPKNRAMSTAGRRTAGRCSTAPPGITTRCRFSAAWPTAARRRGC